MNTVRMVHPDSPTPMLPPPQHPTGGMYTYCLGFACYLQEHFDLSDVTYYATSGGTI